MDPIIRDQWLEIKKENLIMRKTQAKTQQKVKNITQNVLSHNQSPLYIRLEEKSSMHAEHCDLFQLAMIIHKDISTKYIYICGEHIIVRRHTA